MRIQDTFNAPQRIITREAAESGDIAHWEDETGYHRAFIARPATGDPLVRVDGSYEPVPSGAEFIRLLATNPPPVELTHGQWQLVIDALEDSVDRWRRQEDYAATIRDTIGAVVSQLN